MTWPPWLCGDPIDISDSNPTPLPVHTSFPYGVKVYKDPDREQQEDESSDDSTDGLSNRLD